MSREESEDTVFKVVVDHEEQYSIWPADRENALGWSDAGKSGTREECLEFMKKAGKDKLPPGQHKEKGHKHEEGGGGVRGDL